MEIINWVLANWQTIVADLLIVLGAFSVIAKYTKTKSDDKAVQFMYDIIHKLGLTK